MLDAAIEREPGRGSDASPDLRSADGSRVSGVFVDGDLIEGDVVIAMGPWSGVGVAVAAPADGVRARGHSVILRNPIPISPHALFVECEAMDGSVDTPRCSRGLTARSTCAACRVLRRCRIPPRSLPMQRQARLNAMIRTFAPALADVRSWPLRPAYRPVTRDALMAIGRVPGVAGAYVATGHSVWGMLNAPATGEAMAGSSSRVPRGRSTLPRLIRAPGLLT